eukprot:11939896-Alexandrium_andersonii.AAC.1
MPKTDASSSSASSPSSTNALFLGRPRSSELAGARTDCSSAEGGRSRLGERRQRFPNPLASFVT